MTLREKFKPFAYFSDGNNSMEREYQREDNAIECEQIADDYAIEILESYHNSLFNIPLKEGEAKEILKHLKK